MIPEEGHFLWASCWGTNWYWSYNHFRKKESPMVAPTFTTRRIRYCIHLCPEINTKWKKWKEVVSTKDTAASAIGYSNLGICEYFYGMPLGRFSRSLIYLHCDRLLRACSSFSMTRVSCISFPTITYFYYHMYNIKRANVTLFIIWTIHICTYSIKRTHVTIVIIWTIFVQ